ncbi:Highly reducing polyketide synthase [Ascochyta lentis]
MPSTNSSTKGKQDVAIVGLSCRFSGSATSANKFWDMPCNGESGHSETPRFNPKGFSDPGFRKHNQSATAYGHFLQQDVGAFDTRFFGITPEEALAMDPQQRMMLEVAYEAFENAGMTIQQLAGSRTSCFIGSFTSDYREMLFRDADAAPRYTVTGTGVSMLANRVSWFFDLRGPSVALNTACSSSLVALHLARRSLQSGEADIAIVGGTNLMLGSEMFTFFSNLNFLSRDGLSRSFDASGEGYGRGEGVAAVILKRVDDAIQDNDHIRAVVRGTSTNQDGKTKAITLPSLDAQIDLIRSAYKEGGLSFNDTTYFEAHGTGTRRGDPVELEAISKTLCVDRPTNSKIIVGSVKSNVGHTEATAGLAGIIKAIYMLEKGIIPATINYSRPLPEFDLNSSLLTIPVETKPWPGTSVRRISINSFGFGGANAHAVLDDAPSYLASKSLGNGTEDANSNAPVLSTNGSLVNGNGTNEDVQTSTEQLSFLFSGQDQQSLDRNFETMVQHLQTKTFSDSRSELQYLEDLAYTLSERRSRFKVRAEVVASSVTQLVSKIQERSFARVNNDLENTTKSIPAEERTCKLKRRVLVDLPAYSWDHSSTYWAESRVSKEFRLRKHPQRSLIGAPQPSYGENEHIWRGYLRLSDEPWVKDHQVLGAIVYPAAGYIAMAIEAAQDIADKGRKVSRYNLRDVQFHAVAVIKEDVPLELIIQMRPHRSATRSTATSWLEFSISSCHNEKNLRDNCFGLLSIEYESSQDSSMGLEQEREDALVLDKHRRTAEVCHTTQSPKALYQELASVGLTYGEAFQQISEISKTDGLSSCRILSYVPDRFSTPNVIHPATLDCMIQTVFPALPGNHTPMHAAMVPTLLEEMSVSSRTPSAAESFFRGSASARYSGAREMLAEFAMVDQDNRLSVTARGLHCTAISEATNPRPGQDENDRRNICSQLMWVPATDVGSVEQVQNKTTAPARTFPPHDQDILILEGDHAYATALSDALMSLDPVKGSYIPIPKSFLRASLQDLKDKTCIATLEMGTSFLANAATDGLDTFKEIVRRCSRIVWVSSSTEPIGSVITGLARTMRNENAGFVFRTLQVPSQDMYDSENLAEVVSQLAVSSTMDSEFRLERGVLKVSRVLQDTKTDNMVASMARNGGPEILLSTLSQVGTAQELALPRLGMLDDIYFEADETANELLGDEEVEIEVKASGVNFRDVLVVMGNVSDNLIGHEASGIVSRVGSKVTSFRVGVRVCAIGHGCHRSVYRSTADLVHKIPDGMSFEEAATVPLVYTTAYTAIVDLARAQKGQSILIHAAAGGVGLAAIQIATHLGLDIFATVSSEPKRQLLHDHGVMKDHIFNSRDISFAKGIMRTTTGCGLDTVLNSLAGEQLRQSWHCLAPFGNFVEIGIKDIVTNSSLDMSPFAKDATFTAFEVINIMHKDPKRMANILRNVFQLLGSRSVKPVKPLLSKPISEVGEALRLLQAGKHMGKVALTWDRGQTIPMATTVAKPVLSDTATYVLVGGFGGLGQSIARMFADRGARHLCILSRSGARSREAVETINKLENQGVQVRSLACDVSDEGSLRTAFETCKIEMPPIRGVIQGAMVLRDISFEKMSHNQWHEALKPKVDGTWNLHKLMLRDLDFFIILSSFMGIFGSRTQGNYAAAGAYQDALAHYRRSQGLKAVSLDLGLMRDVSAFSKKEALSGPFKDWQEPFGLREVDVHGLLDHVIASEMTAPSTIPAQILTGFGTAKEAEEAGIEPPYYLDDPRFSLLHTTIVEAQQDTATQQQPAETPPNLVAEHTTGDRLRQATSIEDVTDLVLEILIVKVAKHLEQNVANIDPEEPLYTYGVDSLVAIEFRNWIMKEFAADVALLDITAEEPMFDLVDKIVAKSRFLSVSP